MRGAGGGQEVRRQGELSDRSPRGRLTQGKGSWQFRDYLQPPNTVGAHRGEVRVHRLRRDAGSGAPGWPELCRTRALGQPRQSGCMVTTCINLHAK